MKFKSSKRITSWLLCMMLIVAVAFTTVGCGKDNGGNHQPSIQAQGSTENGKNVLGEGQTKFAFVVVDKDGNKYNTGSTSFMTALTDILDELAKAGETDCTIEVYRKESKNYKGKDFITCSIV